MTLEAFVWWLKTKKKCDLAICFFSFAERSLLDSVLQPFCCCCDKQFLGNITKMTDLFRRRAIIFIPSF